MVRLPCRLLFAAVRNKLIDGEGIKDFNRIPPILVIFAISSYFVSISAIKNVKVMHKAITKFVCNNDS